MPILPIIVALAGLATQIGSSIASNKRSKEANQKMRDRSNAAYTQQTAEAEQLKASEGDFMNTALGKQMSEALRRQYNDARKREVSGGLKQGSTEEQKIAANANINDAYARSLGNISAVGTQYRSRVLGQAQELKNAARNRKYGTDMSLLNAENESALNLADNGAKIGSGMMNAAGSLSGIQGAEGIDGAITTQAAQAANPQYKSLFKPDNLDLVNFYKKQQQRKIDDNPFSNYHKAFSLK